MDSTQLGAASTVAIIGGGQAGGEVATLLRQNRFKGRIVLIGEEKHLPYMRPPLSKAFLAREIGADALIYKAAVAYEKAQVEMRLGVRVNEIDRSGKKLLLEGGPPLSYDKLVIATGGRARELPVPGANLRNVLYLRTIADVEVLQPLIEAGRRLVVVGGGYVGLEVAAVAVKRGLAVTVLEGAPRVLARVTAPDLSKFYERIHREAGVDIRTDVTVVDFTAGPDGTGVGAVECDDGQSFAADFVLVGIGLVPNTELAEKASLVVDGGIVVDQESRTNDPDIYAIGDCAMHANHGFLQQRIRIESVPNALEQARAVAASITGKPVPAATAPWFWSDQYGLKLQMVGLSDGYEELAIRGRMDTSSFIAFYLRDGQVIAADSVNRLGEFLAAKRLVGDRARVAASRLADESVSLKTLMEPAAA
ncbi:pyridine nucleotide-disulfide oxidoreductase [Beijerinckiaceae bacterium]|nr:pyridine nucleotide-disulfide oxidoreductase [Beijerinckiaceae bacterium]